MDNLQDVDALIKQHEAEINAKYSTHLSEKLFGTQEWKVEPKSKVFFMLNSESSPHVPFTGIPFIFVARKMMDCHRGPDRHILDKLKYRRERAERLEKIYPNKKRKCRTKKIGCQATIHISQVVQFPDFKIDKNSEYYRKEAAKRLKQHLKDGELVRIQMKYYVKLPTAKDHSGNCLRQDNTIPVAMEPSSKKSKNTLEAIRYKRGELQILNQLLLPLQSEYEEIKTAEDGWHAIKLMKVRGAPAIAIVGTLSIALEIINRDFADKDELVTHICDRFQYVNTARPTAVNMSEATERFTSLARRLQDDPASTVQTIRDSIVEEAELMLEVDRETNKRIGRNGAVHILESSGDAMQTVMTHCNTGSLATAGYGTALGVIRALHEMGKMDHVYCTETRPYNQGARLTAYELVFENIPASLIADSMASFCMLLKGVTAVVVGADRVVANGDTANKIGTYQLALAAKHHNIPFYVAAPATSCDLRLSSGSDIVIEERPHKELTSINGVQIAAAGIGCWNPAFDVTPADLISGIITEHGVFEPSELKQRLLALASP